MDIRFPLAAIFAGLASSTSYSVLADPPRFQLVGEGTLLLDRPLQKSGNMQLKATLTPSEATTTAMQVGGGFALTATLAASSMACYNDTIFRDGFDGDGV